MNGFNPQFACRLWQAKTMEVLAFQAENVIYHIQMQTLPGSVEVEYT